MVGHFPDKRRTFAVSAVLTLTIASMAVLVAGGVAAQTAPPPGTWTAVYRDIDGDGFIDAVDLAYGKSVSGSPIGIDEDSIRPGDFKITHASMSIVPHDWKRDVNLDAAKDPSPGDKIATGCTTAVDDPCFRLLFREDPEFTTGVVPTLQYLRHQEGVPRGALQEATVAQTRVDSFQVSTATSSAYDGAPPVLWGASAVKDQASLHLVFSENVATGVVKTDLCLEHSPTAGLAAASPDTIVAVGAGGAPGRTVTMAGADKPVAADLGNQPGKFIVGPCGVGSPASVKDLAGNTAARQSAELAWNGKTPALVSASGNMGSNKVFVRFASGVGIADGATAPKSPLSTGVVHVEQATSGGGSLKGFVAVRHVAGSPWAELTGAQNVTAGDLSSNGGAKVYVAANNVYAYGESNQPVPGTPVALVDNSDPYIKDSLTIDANGNGLIDAIQITFNEKIFDGGASFGSGPGKDLWDVEAILPQGTGGVRTEIIEVIEVITGGKGQTTCLTEPGPRVADDNIIYLCFNEGVYELDNNGVRVCNKGECLPSHSQPAVTYNAPPIAPRIQDRAPAQNTLKSVFDFPARDAVQPRLIDACTFDTDKNGRLNGYTLQFSEMMPTGILSTSAVAEEFWAVMGYAGTAKSGGEQGDAPALAAASGSGQSSKFWTLSWTENDDDSPTYGDTGALPELLYEPDFVESEKIVVDAAGNILLGIGAASRDFQERDCAAPVTLAVQGVKGTKQVKITFSEGVRRALDDGGLQAADFQYHNIWSLNATAIVAVSHKAGDSIAILDTDQPLSATQGSGTGGDIGTDQISGRPNAIAHMAENPELYIKSGKDNSLPSRQVIEESTEDINPPPAPRPITVTAGPNPQNSVKLSFPAVKDPSGISAYEVRYDTIALDTSAFDTPTQGTLKKFTSGIVATGTQTLTVTGLTPGKGYYFAVRAVDGNDGAGNAGVTLTAFTTEAGTAGKDETKPDPMGPLQEVSVNANSFGVRFTVPSDDVTGKQDMRYIVELSSTALTKDDNCGKTQLPNGVTCFLHGLQPDGTRVMNFNGLQAETEYFITVSAVDQAGNVGDPSPQLKVTTGKDDTPPLEAPVISWPGHKSGVATKDIASVRFTWTEVEDLESTVAYYWAVNTDADYKITGSSNEERTFELTATPSNLAVGDQYFHVAAVSAGGAGPTATWDLRLRNDPGLVDEDITDSNKAVRDTVVVRKTDGGNQIEWTLPTTLPAVPQGVQIWCGDDSGYELVETIDKTTDTTLFNAGTYLDTAPCDGGMYKVTVYYELGEGLSTAGNENEVAGFSEIEGTAVEEDESGVPGWLIIALIVLGVVVILVGLILIITLGRKKGAAPAGEWKADGEDGWAESGEEDSWDPVEEDDTPAWAGDDLPDDAPEPAFADEEPNFADEGNDAEEEMDMPFQDELPPVAAEPGLDEAAQDAADEGDSLHHVTCPECSGNFVAEGAKPLRIECPDCGVQGVLN